MNKKGMTLIELIVAIGVIGIIMLFIAASMRPVILTYGAQKALNENKDIANNTLAIIKNEIRDAKGSVSVQTDLAGCDAWIVQGKNTINFGGDIKNKLPNSYYQGHEVWVRFSTVQAGISVIVNVNGYELEGVYFPYKPNVITSAVAGGSLCIIKEATDD